MRLFMGSTLIKQLSCTVCRCNSLALPLWSKLIRIVTGACTTISILPFFPLLCTSEHSTAATFSESFKPNDPTLIGNVGWIFISLVLRWITFNPFPFAPLPSDNLFY